MIDQIGIALTGVTAIFLTQSTHEWLRRYACLFGIAGQPFWFYSAISAEQWGVALLCCLYTLAWVKGVWTHWIRPVAPAVNPLTKAGYVMSESGKAYRLIMGFETMDDMHAAQDEMIRPRAAQRHEGVRHE